MTSHLYADLVLLGLCPILLVGVFILELHTRRKLLGLGRHVIDHFGKVDKEIIVLRAVKANMLERLEELERGTRKERTFQTLVMCEKNEEPEVE